MTHTGDLLPNNGAYVCKCMDCAKARATRVAGNVKRMAQEYYDGTKESVDPEETGGV